MNLTSICLVLLTLAVIFNVAAIRQLTRAVNNQIDALQILITTTAMIEGTKAVDALVEIAEYDDLARTRLAEMGVHPYAAE